MKPLKMRYYVDVDNNYLGGWDENPPEDAVEVSHSPDHKRQKWNGVDDYLPLVLTPEEEDREEIKNNSAIQALLTKRSSEMSDHITPMTLPELKVAVLLLMKQVKLLSGK